MHVMNRPGDGSLCRRAMIRRSGGCENAAEFQRLERDGRDAALREALKGGASIRQAARLTGVSIRHDTGACEEVTEHTKNRPPGSSSTPNSPLSVPSANGDPFRRLRRHLPQRWRLFYCSLPPRLPRPGDLRRASRPKVFLLSSSPRQPQPEGPRKASTPGRMHRGRFSVQFEDDPPKQRMRKRGGVSTA